MLMRNMRKFRMIRKYWFSSNQVGNIFSFRIKNRIREAGKKDHLLLRSLVRIRLKRK